MEAMRVLPCLTLLLFLAACGQAEPSPVQRGQAYLDAKVAEAAKAEEDAKTTYWPSGLVKSKWSEESGAIVRREYYESGVLKCEARSDNHNGFPGSCHCLQFFDEDGVLRNQWYRILQQVLDFSDLGDVEVEKEINPHWISGIYMRRNTKATDAALESIAKLEKLEWLDITGCKQFSDAAIAKFKEQRPKCEVRR